MRGVRMGEVEKIKDILLVIDDDPDAHVQVRGILDPELVRITSVSTGRKAIEWLQNNKAELLLLDYTLPDMTGSKLIKALNADGSAVPPFIVVTGTGDEKVAVEMMKMGARDYIMKDGLFLDNVAQIVPRVMNELRTGKALSDAREALQRKTDELDHFFSVALDLLCISDLNGVFKRINPQWERTLGYSKGELEGMAILELVHPDDQATTGAVILQLSRQIPIEGFVNRCRCRDGSYRWIEWCSSPMGGLVYSAARDMTNHMRLEEELRHLAAMDPLTGVFNRRTILELSERELMWSRIQGLPLSICMMDVDSFKRINDTFGHAAGDKALKMVIFRCSGVLRKSDTIGRIGGEEFLIVMSNTLPEAALQVAERLRSGVEQSDFGVDGNSIGLSVSVGVTSLVQKDSNLDDLICRADAALYRAKRNGKNRVESDFSEENGGEGNG
jgi:diguanylate cyclase (GGDEF)-like protein/PAS domain S-box-containing protein